MVYRYLAEDIHSQYTQEVNVWLHATEKNLLEQFFH